MKQQQKRQQKWIKMPLLSPEMQKAGIFPGGEGGQWFRDLVISASNPDFLLLGIDVGGIYRTKDGGKNWEQCSNGWDARGSIALAIDPQNSDHVLGVAGNSLDWNAGWGQSPHGIYVSFDGADSWKQTLVRLDGTGAAYEGQGGSVCFDASSYSAQKKQCLVAYYVGKLPGLWKTTDGGLNWAKVAERFDNVRLKTQKGSLFLGGKEGLFVTRDGGKSFTQLSPEPITGLDAVGDRVFVTGAFGIKLSRDGGKTFVGLNTSGIVTDGKPIENIAVSPVDAGRVCVWVKGDNWQWRRYISHDGGKSWRVPKINATHAVLPNNVRQGHWAWHPTNAQVVYTFSGDTVYKSTDGGVNYQWSANGYNGIMLGGMFGFSAHAPETVFLAFQDYNGAFTTDGGKTWNYRDVSGKGWGGQCYGGFAVDKEVLWYGDAEGWGGPRRLRLSKDGGKTWSFLKDANGKEIVFTGVDASFADPSDPNILFASNWRSPDKGKSWESMPFCDAVLTAIPNNLTATPDKTTLFGKKGNTVVISHDKGASWETIAAQQNITDIAYDPLRKRLYVTANDRLHFTLLNQGESDGWFTLPTPPNQHGGHRITTVAVDPINPAILYLGSHTDIFACNNAVLRSRDTGRTWENLTTGNGPHEVSCIRVHPKTREAWVAGSCYGMWKISPPAS
jgi:photosystem II stability/assembly factor-like uncharacterized protein